MPTFSANGSCPGTSTTRRWHLARAPELDQILDAASLEDYRVDVSGTTVSEAAVEVAELVRWMR